MNNFQVGSHSVRSTLVPVLALLLALVGVSGCTKSKAKEQVSGSGAGDAVRTSRAETLVVAREQGPNSLDIHGVGTNRPAYGASWNVYDRLVSYGSKKHPSGVGMYDYASLQPELAERWEVNDQEIIFHLRKDAVFHDGSPVSAEDVKWSYERALAVGGFPTFQMKAGSIEQPSQFVVVDDHTFKLKLIRKDKLTLPDLGVPVAAIYNATLAKTHASSDDPWAQEWLKNNTAAGGAFRVEKFEPGVELVLVRNEQWKSGPLPRLKKVVERVIPSASTRRAMVERGDVDLSFDLPPRDFSDLTKVNTVKVTGVPVENFMWYLDMNVTQPPFDDLNVRKAIAAAVPYDAIFDTTCYGRGIKLYGAKSDVPETTEWPQPYPYSTNVKRARELLSESEHPQGFNAKLYYNLGQATWSEPIALLVQQSLKQLGITLTLEKVPAGNWRAEMGKKSMGFLLNDMGGWLNYPDYFFFWNYHGQNAVFNTMSYQNPEMDKLIDTARFAESEDLYQQSVKGFIKIAFDDVPRIPLYQSNLDVALSPKVSGYQYWFHRQVDYRQLWKGGA